MISQSLVFTGPQGLHARPAGALVKKAKEFESSIQIVYESNSFNAKAITKLLSAGIKNGAELTVTAEGADEEQAVNSIVEFLANVRD
mgnify:CR=1 FL=1